MVGEEPVLAISRQVEPGFVISSCKLVFVISRCTTDSGRGGGGALFRKCGRDDVEAGGPGVNQV